MLHNKSTTIISDINDFFTTSEKAINTILTICSSLRISEKQIGLESKSNNEYNNITKFFLILMFPFFDVSNAWKYKNSVLFPILSCGKDVFYRLINSSSINWRKISYKISMQLITKTSVKSIDNQENKLRCIIVDDTDMPKTGMKIELIGKVFSHVTQKSCLAFKGLFMGYHDGKSFFSIDFSLHGEKGKNQKKPFGLTKKQLKDRYSKKRPQNSASQKRKKEYYQTKIFQMIEMLKSAINEGLRFEYVLVDSWFTCFELIKFINTRRIGCHLLGMAKMGLSKYSQNGKELNAKQIIDNLRKTKKIKHSKTLNCYYSEVLVDFKGIEVKLFFCKTSRKGKWHLLLTTDLKLNFEKAYKIYSIRWSIEVFFKESKQYLGLGKCQSQDFDAHIATTTICMIQYNILSVAKRFTDYESLGELFRKTNAETIELTVAEKIWQLINELLNDIAEILEIDIESLIGKLIADNEKLIKLSNYTSLLKAG